MLFYLIGIKGSALSAMAKILCHMGHIVRGVDVEEEFYTIKNTDSIRIENFSNMKLNKCYFYIIGNAYVKHSVTKYIQNMGFKWMTYPAFLNYYFQNKKWICICGTSGKTTTTKMISTMLPNSTALIGDGSFCVGNDSNFILESCEYRNTFLNYHPFISLVLNINYDHIDFFKTKKEYEDSFIKFINQSEICVLNGDEISYRDSHVITFGMKQDNDISFTYEDGKVTILRKSFVLPIKGMKYAYDFVGAYVVAKLVNEKDFAVLSRISKFQMPKRRFERVELNSQIIISDYAHHPNEIAAIYETITEEYPEKKKICIFEPHTVSRLQYFLKDYQEVLKKFDKAYLFSLFTSARESHQPVLEKELYRKLGYSLYSYSVKMNLLAEENSVICFLGAGVIDKAFTEYKSLQK